MRQLPNLLTWARIAMTPVCVYYVLTGRFDQAFPWTIVTGLTDTADGLAARWLKVESRFGARLDPIADKLLLTALYISFGVVNLAPQWLVWLVVGRDILILTLVAAGMALKGIRDFPPTLWGKLSTALQIVGVLLLLKSSDNPELRSFTIAMVALASAWSGVHYLWRGIVMYRSSRQIV